MSKLQWAAVGTILLLGIISQIPRHDHERMPGHDHEHALAHDEDVMPGDAGQGALPANRERVVLEIRGMT